MEELNLEPEGRVKGKKVTHQGNKEELVTSQNARTVLEKRYLGRDRDGKINETPFELFERVAKAISQATLLYENEAARVKDEREFLELLASFYFMPNSPTLMNAGRRLGQLSACFVLPVGDSMEDIFETVKNTALIHKSGGGTGFSFSRLRPKNDLVKSTRGISSGPVSFMSVFDAATEAIKQGGTRRGANMAVLSVTHPDIVEFITSKRDEDKLTNFNISCAVTDEFMKAVFDDKEYDLVNPRTCEIVRPARAREIFDLIVDSAWASGEPGIIFIDRINEKNPIPDAGMIESTNPCGEQPLLPYESCNLGSINLSKMVTLQNKQCKIDWERLRGVIKTGVKFLDNVIDVNRYPLPMIEDTSKQNRKIGLGVMGFADLLISLGIPYNSDTAVSTAEKIAKFIQDESKLASMELARTRGSFPNFNKSIYKREGKECIRNATTTTIAPTGTISIISSCSSGIEPLFAIAYQRTVLDKNVLPEFHPYFIELARERGFYSEKLLRDVSRIGHLKDIDDVPLDVKKLFVTAHEITPAWHIKMQAAFQKYTDNAVSKTVNFPKSAARDDIYNVYTEAYKLGCKGVTVYRDNCRKEQVLKKGKREDTKAEQETPRAGIQPRPRPTLVHGTTRKVKTGCGNLYVTINEDEESRPFEVFSQIGKAGGCAASQCEAISRIISFTLRCNVDVEPIIKQLRGISCHRTAWDDGKRILSCADAIGQSLEKYLNLDNGKKPRQEEFNFERREVLGACPDCGGMLEHVEGCMTCHSCGYSECA